ncbi:hypothetical protein SAMN04488132_1063 [Sediminibacterium ginsengisoli]|uniref:Uncharacterized protein n=1 Tax=Sediminibacterium ginsengisoli TaxID=413434 RepID=A0A1T4PGN8_9BACT|nr:hypothetical protein SAMN04488132_1063 [Sediminibacterium ginsengisoli]
MKYGVKTFFQTRKKGRYQPELRFFSSIIYIIFIKNAMRILACICTIVLLAGSFISSPPSRTINTTGPGSVTLAGEKAVPPLSAPGKCTGSDPCRACSNCSACKHCKSGGSCGVCNDRGKTKSPSSPSIPQKKNSSQCQATTKKGSRCSRAAATGSSYCWQHGK